MSEYIYKRERVADGVFAAESTGEEIVRCRDCKWCMAYWKAMYCDKFSTALPEVEPDGFCAWAERREV